MGAVLFVCSNHGHSSQHIEWAVLQVEIIEAGWDNWMPVTEPVWKLESQCIVNICGSGEVTEDILIVSDAMAPDSAVELRIAGVLFPIALPSADERST